MDIIFDEQNLKELGKKYRSFVSVTDYVRHVTVFKGPLNEGCFEAIQFYLDNGWLDGCTWTKREVAMKSGWTKLITEAIDKDGEEIFNITVNIKNRMEVVLEKPKKSSDGGKYLLLGALAGLFSLPTVLEAIGAGYLINQLTKKKEENGTVR